MTIPAVRKNVKPVLQNEECPLVAPLTATTSDVSHISDLFIVWWNVWKRENALLRNVLCLIEHQFWPTFQAQGSFYHLERIGGRRKDDSLRFLNFSSSTSWFESLFHLICWSFDDRWIDWLFDWSIDRLIDQLSDWLINWLIELRRSIYRCIDWLIDCVFSSSDGSFAFRFP